MSVKQKYIENMKKNAMKTELFDKILGSKQYIDVLTEYINLKTSNRKYSKHDGIGCSMFSTCKNSPNVSYGETNCYTTHMNGLSTTLNAGSQGPRLF